MGLPLDVRQCLSANKQNIETFTTIYQVDGDRNFLQNFYHLATQKEKRMEIFVALCRQERNLLYNNFSITNVGHTSFDVF